MRSLMMLTVAWLCCAAATSAQPLPVVEVRADDTRIDHSCIVRIAPDSVIADANGNGVIHIVADGITVVFQDGSVLRGAPQSARPDGFAGTGIVIQGRRDVTLRGARVAGFKVGIRADESPGLVIDSADLSGNFRQHLRSTPQAEDSGDWLWPHDNDNGEWLSRYGAALGVRASDGITIRNVRVRDGQNGIVLDRVNGSWIYDNDCSFLSGWGLAMWRSSRNIVSRNAFDFCIRGYSHGVYNRGQDSAGILMFEQCEANLIIENSATHGGDGLFGFAGKEALGERIPPDADEDFFALPRGNNGNIIVGNDFSYAAAHGLEMTFSHENRIEQNQFIGNAICGIWGGYSQETLIAGNIFEQNGDAGYGLERGGVNIEHGSGNQIIGNHFRENAAGIHLWWDDDGPLLERPGIRPHYRGVSDNIIARNRFEGDSVVLHLRDLSTGEPRVVGTVYAHNITVGVAREFDVPERLTLVRDADPALPPRLELEAIGSSRPVGARSALAGRRNIIMTEWGPWDHQGPLARLVSKGAGRHVYAFLNIDSRHVRVSVDDQDPVLPVIQGMPDHWTTTVFAPGAGIFPYRIVVDHLGHREIISGTLVSAAWDVDFFPWEGSVNPPLPPADLDEWRQLAEGDRAVRVQTDALSFRFGSGGPSQLREFPALRAAGLGRDFFGLIARASIPLRAGAYRVQTLSDDGVRVIVDGKTILENWTHHGPTRDSGVFSIDTSREVQVVVEYFEIAGYAVLELDIVPIEAGFDGGD